MNLKKVAASMLLTCLVIGVVFTGACATEEVSPPVQKASAPIIEDITAQGAFTLIQDNQNNPDFVILDVRTPEEFTEEHIAKAVNIDFYAETFQDELNGLDRDKKYLIYCRSGGRSRSALDIMAELNFREAYNMLGGIIDWKAEGLPTIK